MHVNEVQILPPETLKTSASLFCLVIVLGSKANLDIETQLTSKPLPERPSTEEPMVDVRCTGWSYGLYTEMAGELSGKR